MDVHKLYLNGRWVAPGPPIDVVNPANGQCVGRVATADRSVVAQALADAERLARMAAACRAATAGCFSTGLPT